MAGTDVTIPTPDGGAMPAFLAEAPGPGLLIIPAIFGVDPGMQQLATDISAHGFTVLVPDPFWRTDPGVCGFDEAGFARGRARAKAFDLDQGRADVQAALAWIKARPGSNGKAAALGVCFGGRFALFAAADGVADAAVTFHGGGLDGHLDLAPLVKCPISLHFAGDDAGAAPAQVDAIRAAFAAHPDARVAVYPGVQHGFTHPGSPKFDAPAAAKAHGDLLARLGQLR